MTMSRDRVKCRFESGLEISLRGCQLSLTCIVASKMIDGYQLLLGMDAINKIGFVTFRKGQVIFGNVARIEAQSELTVEAQGEPRVEGQGESSQWSEA